MSIQAMTWAYGQKMKSSVKFVLVTLCNYADVEGRLWPSVADLVERTCLDRKTVIAAVGKLEEAGFLVDTGERKGRTRQVKVFRIEMKGTGNGSFEEVRKRKVSEGGRVPFFPGKDAAFGCEVSLVSHERVPETGYGICHELLDESSGNHQYACDVFLGEAVLSRGKGFVPLGYLTAKGVDADVAGDWLAMRKARKAQPTRTAIDGIASEAQKAGISLEEALRVCCANGWQGFRADWISRRENGQAGGSHYDRNMQAVERAKKLIFGGQDA